MSDTIKLALKEIKSAGIKELKLQILMFKMLKDAKNHKDAKNELKLFKKSFKKREL